MKHEQPNHKWKIGDEDVCVPGERYLHRVIAVGDDWIETEETDVEKPVMRVYLTPEEAMENMD